MSKKRFGKVGATGVHEKTSARRIGNLGEEIAQKFLIKNGFLIIDVNVNRKWGEIDIVAKKEKRIHFCEIKSVTRTKEQIDKGWGHDPKENMTSVKIRKLIRTAELLSQEMKVVGPWQLDALMIYIDIKSRLARVEHVENVSL